jgi:RNA polymerase sigma-70 factor (ECF subfamily)
VETTLPSDEELMVRFQAGDMDSFGVLAQRYERPLYSLAARYLGRPEDAEEIRQEALLKAYSQARSFKPGGRFRSWIYRIALNLCHDRNRRKNRLRWISWGDVAGEGQEEPPIASNSRTDEEVELLERARQVRRALQWLPREQRDVLVLKEFEELKFREIAELLGCPESTVKSRLYRGLTALRTHLSAD